MTIASEENDAALLVAAAVALDCPLAARWFGAPADEEADVSDARETLCSRVEAREDRVVVAAELLRKPYCAFVLVTVFEVEGSRVWDSG